MNIYFSCKKIIYIVLTIKKKKKKTLAMSTNDLLKNYTFGITV